VYETPPAPKSLDCSFLSDDMSLFHHHRQQHRDADQMSVSSTASSTGGPSPRDRRSEGVSPSIYMPMAPGHAHGHSPGSNSKVSVSVACACQENDIKIDLRHLCGRAVVSTVMNLNGLQFHGKLSEHQLELAYGRTSHRLSRTRQ
jgi:hypothetical protein